jgi:predicted MPP superfamily phosphohydrolase
MHQVVKYGHHTTTYGSLIFGIVITFIILLLIDLYVYKGVRAAFSHSGDIVKRIVMIIYWLATIFFVGLGLYILSTFTSPTTSTGYPFKLFAASFIILYSPKILFGLFLLVEDTYRLIRAIVIIIFRASKKQPVVPNELFQSRRKFIGQVATLVAGVPFIGSIYGVTKGKYHFRIHKAEIAFKDLPKAFDGFTITQVSDIHSGSFGDTHEVMRGVDMANAQNSDLLLFTGDLVNFRASEMERWVEVFNRFKAPMGKYSILGNHDYGDYVQWATEEEKKANLNRLCDFHKQIGFSLMRNENLKLTKNNETIELLGSENWGRGGFSKYGDLDKTLAGTTPGAFKILMSHDPTHWEEKVMNNPETIHLTLSGHTHGFQFGFEIPGVARFSPVQFQYKRWAGLYAENGRYLYVNRGFGYIGFPGRVGIWPEITVITLRCA